jgi:hypothetical protein
MDNATLVKELIDDGKRIIEALDATNFDVKAAMWFYQTDTGEWQLIIASPYLDNSGPIRAYEFVQNKMATISPAPGIKIKNIALKSPQDELIKLMRIAIRTGHAISGIRFTQNVINNVLIEDAFIYRMM